MNSKVILLFLFVIISCGVKTRPRAPKDSKIPSIIDKYVLPDKNIKKKK